MPSRPLVLAAVISTCSLAAFEFQHVRAAEPSEGGWQCLLGDEPFAGWRKDRRGWTAAESVTLDPAEETRLAAKPGVGVVFTQGDGDNLETEQEFQDVEVELEFLIAKDSNSGIKLNGLYEIQIRDTPTVNKPTGDQSGGVYPRARLSPRYKLLDNGTPPLENAALPAGEWQTLKLRFRSPRFDADGKKTANARFQNVVMNGKTIHKDVELTNPTGHAWNSRKEVARGPLLLQGDHGPVAVRKLRVRALH